MRARRSQRVDLEPQMAVDLVLGGALLLHLLDAVAVAQQLEVLPGGEEEDGDQEDADRHRPPHLEVPLAIDLAHDRVVADVLLGLRIRNSPLMTFLPAPVPPREAWRCARAGCVRLRLRLGTIGRFVANP